MARRRFHFNPHEVSAEERVEDSLREIKNGLASYADQLAQLNLTKPTLSMRYLKTIQNATTDLVNAQAKLLTLLPEGARRYHLGMAAQLDMAAQAEHKGYVDQAAQHFFDVERYEAELQRRRRG